LEREPDEDKGDDDEQSASPLDDEDEPIPDHILDLMAEESLAMDRLERGLCL
jgi:hypothetical protein